MPFQVEYRVPKTTWDAGAAQNTGIAVDLTLPGALRGLNGNIRALMKSITIVSKDNGSWEIHAYAKATRFPADMDSDFFLGRWTFLTTDAVQDSADGNNRYRYYVDGNDIPLRDDDKTGKLHLTLIRRDAALTANPGHEVVIELRLQPIGAA